MTKIDEKSLVDMLSAFLLKEGSKVYREVPTLGKSADLVLVEDKGLTFIEVKINAVKRAIEQCKAHELVADYICVAIGTKSVSQSSLSEISELGYGLISCSLTENNCTWLVKPKRQLNNWPPVKRTVYQRMIAEDVCLPNIG